MSPYSAWPQLCVVIGGVVGGSLALLVSDHNVTATLAGVVVGDLVGAAIGLRALRNPPTFEENR